MKTKLLLLSAFFLSLALIFTITASAAIPHLMNYQGKATDKSGSPLNGTYNLTFRIYNTETSGTPKWSETQPNIQISNGIFQVQLGSINPLNLPFDEPYWISLEINSDGEMSPRTRFNSVPYAYKAESLAEAAAIPFYRKGFDIVPIDFNSIKISAGVMDLAGKMIATTAYSNPVLLEYLDDPKNRDWIHGSKLPNITAYVYAYNNNSQIAFKFSDEAPNLSDQYGNITQKPFLYRRYPNTSAGLYYRYLGQIPLDSAGNINSVFIISSDILSVYHGIQVFATPGTYTFKSPAGVTQVFVEGVGGGGGGTETGYPLHYHCGGGGGYCAKVCTLTTDVTVTVGAGGASGAPGGGDGGVGGNSTFGSFFTAGGGQIAEGGNPAGGTATGGDINIPGQPGSSGAPGGQILNGGNSKMGFGGINSPGGLSGPVGYGAGGAAAIRASQAGTGGIVIVRW